jgi:DNA polymerase III gamma/tau subunit
MMVKLSNKPEAFLDIQVCNLQILQDQSKAFHVDELQQMFSVLSRTEAEMKRSSLAEMIFEMSILRLADIRPFHRIDDMIEAINSFKEEAKLPVTLPIIPVNSVKDKPINPESVELTSDQGSDLSSNWEQIKQEICARKTVFNHYFAQCKVLAFNEASLDLGLQVKSPENLQLVKDAVKLVCNREISVTLAVSDQAQDPVTNPSSSGLASKEKKTNSLNQNRDKSETEIIRDALDVFGGEVIK